MTPDKLVLSCVGILLASGLACSAATESERMFLWNEANAIMASAGSAEDYIMAAQVYQNMVDKGIRNGPVFYNLGTALLNAGAHDGAVEALLRAERYLGAGPDIANNLAIALARKAGRDEIQPMWHRIPLFWHFRLSTRIRAVLTAAAFSLFWMLLALRKFGAGRWTSLPKTIVLVICIMLASSVATSLHQETRARRFVPALPTPPPASTGQGE